MFFCQFFRQEREKWPYKSFWTAQIRQILQIGEIQKSQRTAWKMTIFDVKNTESRSFFNISTWNFGHIYTWQGSLTCFQLFWKSKMFAFLRITFLLIFLNQSFLNFDNPRQQINRNIQIKTSVENQSFLSLKLFAWQRFPQTLISP